jgi:hypothetical protein
MATTLNAAKLLKEVAEVAKRKGDVGHRIGRCEFCDATRFRILLSLIRKGKKK